MTDKLDLARVEVNAENVRKLVDALRYADATFGPATYEQFKLIDSGDSDESEGAK